MAVTKKEIEHVAKLARLDSSGGAFDRLAHDLSDIVDMVDRLQELDLGSAADVLDTERTNVLREDIVKESFPTEKIIKNAPTSENGGISVPRIVE